jgi:A/G-specific adenine glycosylase
MSSGASGIDARKVAVFRRAVWKYWKEHGRHELPWRKTVDPYRILVSEVMLQQTQVPRVIEKYKEFLRAFPNVRTLARADLSHVLRVWSGLGYNRRAKFLHEAARAIVMRHRGAVPRELSALRALPGFGPYTAAAVRVFAFNEPDVLLETNVRTAVIHHFFADADDIHDKQVAPIAAAAARGQDPRQWHSALFDYGVYLKATHGNASRKSAHYVRQSTFDGSLRQVRGAVLKTLAAGNPVSSLSARFGDRLEQALSSLATEGLIVRAGRGWRLP